MLKDLLDGEGEWGRAFNEPDTREVLRADRDGRRLSEDRASRSPGTIPRAACSGSRATSRPQRARRRDALHGAQAAGLRAACRCCATARTHGAWRADRARRDRDRDRGRRAPLRDRHRLSRPRRRARRRVAATVERHASDADATAIARTPRQRRRDRDRRQPRSPPPVLAARGLRERSLRDARDRLGRPRRPPRRCAPDGPIPGSGVATPGPLRRMPPRRWLNRRARYKPARDVAPASWSSSWAPTPRSRCGRRSPGCRTWCARSAIATRRWRSVAWWRSAPTPGRVCSPGAADRRNCIPSGRSPTAGASRRPRPATCCCTSAPSARTSATSWPA